MKNVMIVCLLLISILLTGCSPSTSPSSDMPPAPVEMDNIDSCAKDSDCACGGVDAHTGMCFLGNKDYQAKYVDRSKDCPDFCSGIAGNLVVKCIDKKCIQMMECVSDSDCAGGKCVRNRCEGGAAGPAEKECSSSADCIKGGCSGELCRSKDAEPVASICIYKQEYDCLKMVDCGCIDGKCAWSTSPEYEQCVSDAPGLVIVP